MSIEYEIINHLKENPGQTTKKIATAISCQRYKVVLIMSKLLWQQRVELAGYTYNFKSGHSHPTYNATRYRGVTIQ